MEDEGGYAALSAAPDEEAPDEDARQKVRAHEVLSLLALCRLKLIMRFKILSWLKLLWSRPGLLPRAPACPVDLRQKTARV